MAESKGWFVTEDRTGDRTLEQQMRGLGPLLAEVPGKTVLDVGCAEGLISMELARAGAASVYGVEIVHGHVEMARKLTLTSGLPCRFSCLDANKFDPVQKSYDIVIMLALLHKLWDPGAGCLAMADAARELCVIRVPPGFGRVIVDHRSNFQPYPLDPIMERLGFAFEFEMLGPFDEPTLYYRRVG